MASNVSSEFPDAVTDVVKASVSATFASIFGQPPSSVSFDSEIKPCSCVASAISFFGAHSWSLTLIVPEPTAVAMALKFAGFDIPFDSADMGDVVGELTNVLAGEVIAQLVHRGIPAKMSLPTIARGNDVVVLQSRTSATRQLSYQSPQGHFWFEVSTASCIQNMCRRSGAAV